jgi:hypothetical protein
MTYKTAALTLSLLPLLAACASDGSQGASASNSTLGQVTSGARSAGAAVANAAGQVPSLVNVDLRNVLNDLAVRLQIDRANVPVTIQLPITLAANVCGVSVNVLSGSTGGQANCQATTAPQELAQVVQQQMAGGGSVGGGAQGGSTAATGSSTPASGTAASGASDTNATSGGSSETTTTPSPQ